MKLLVRVGQNDHDLEVSLEGSSGTVRSAEGELPLDARRIDGDVWSLILAGRSWDVTATPSGPQWRVRVGPDEFLVDVLDPTGAGVADASRVATGPAVVTSVMPGRIVRVLVKDGDEVAEAQGLVVVEAMKMENEIGAPRAGRVKAVKVAPGQAVESGAVLVELE